MSELNQNIENGTSPLIEVRDLKQYFNINMGWFKSKPLKAVDGVSFYINKGETLGLVGESGCGKTTVGRTLLNLYKPTAGEIYFKGQQVKTPKEAFRQRERHPHHACAQQAVAQRVALHRIEALQQEKHHQKSREGAEKLPGSCQEKRLFVRHPAFEVHGKEFEIQLHSLSPPARKAAACRAAAWPSQSDPAL